jgi:Ferritin-like domain
VSEPSTRRTALAGAAGGALALAALTARVAAQSERSDVEIIEELLTFEHRLESAYAAALRRDAIDTELGELLRNQEREHIRALEQVLRELGGRSPRASVPPPELGSALRGRDAFARFALDLEQQATSAYVDAAGGISRPGLRRPLGSIMACEAAHQVALRSAAGLPLLAPAR